MRNTEQAITAGAVAAADAITAYRDGTWQDNDDLSTTLLAAVSDLETAFAVILHLSRVAVAAAPADALTEQLDFTRKMGRPGARKVN